MGWETRRNGRSYYYRKKRVDGRVVSEYVGSGPAALLAQMQDAREAHERTAAETSVHEDEVLNSELQEHAELIFSEVHRRLIEHGYHKHRGQWRKKRTCAVGSEAAG